MQNQRLGLDLCLLTTEQSKHVKFLHVRDWWNIDDSRPLARVTHANRSHYKARSLVCLSYAQAHLNGNVKCHITFTTFISWIESWKVQRSTK